MAEQRYQAVLAVIKDGRTVTEVAAAVGVSRQTLHAWLGRYEAGGYEGLVDRSHRPRSCPDQLTALVEVAVLEARRRHPSWGPRRVREGSRSSWVGMGWERGRPNELWQFDVVGGFLLKDGSRAEALTGVDDRSRFCVPARLMARERTRQVCDGLSWLSGVTGCRSRS